MKDYLLDIVKHTQGLGMIELAKITGTEDETNLLAVAPDRTIILKAKFKNPIAEFIGTFGMPNLGKLNTILNIPEYKDDAKIVIKNEDRNGEMVPVGVHFENKNGDFKNDYRFMSANIINEQLKDLKFKGAKWNIDIVPTVVGIQKLKFQQSANSEELNFIAKTENNNLQFYFGDHSSHAGNFVFASDVAGKLTRSWSWPVAAFISVLSLPGDKNLKISDEGATMITVDSGLAQYDYIILSQTK